MSMIGESHKIQRWTQDSFLQWSLKVSQTPIQLKTKDRNLWDSFNEISMQIHRGQKCLISNFVLLVDCCLTSNYSNRKFFQRICVNPSWSEGFKCKLPTFALETLFVKNFIITLKKIICWLDLLRCLSTQKKIVQLKLRQNLLPPTTRQAVCTVGNCPFKKCHFFRFFFKLLLYDNKNFQNKLASLAML